MSRKNGLVTRGITVVIVVVVLTSGVSVQAALRQVPGQYANIQAALNAAAGGDEVVLAQGTYTGKNNRNLDFGGKAVLVRSSNPKDPAVVATTVIDCLGSASAPRRAATLNCSSDVYEAGLAGLTITGAYDPEGAVVCDVASTPVIRDCVIHANNASGIAGRASSAARIVDCRIENNVTNGNGGGINLVLECQPAIERCVIRGNNGAKGGGVYCYQGWPEVLDSEISGNYAENGGAIYWEDSGVSLAGCTVAGNSAQLGAGVYGLSNIYYDTSAIRNCVISGNPSGDGRQVSLAVSAFRQHTDTLAVSYSLIQGGQQGVSAPEGWTLNWQGGNLAGNVDAGFAGANGADGKWDTWQDNDYRLSSGSACVDAGDPAGSYAGKTDAAGQVRLVGAKVDVGAYEAVAIGLPVALVGDINSDGHVDVVDLMSLSGAFGSSKGQAKYDALCDFNGDDAVDVTDLMMLADNWGV